jgi:peptide/nickel transport system substrate-binding protein
VANRGNALKGITATVGRTACALAYAVACALLAAGCGSVQAPATDTAEGAAPVRGGEVRVGIVQEPATMNPYILASGVVDATVFDPMSDALVEWGPDSQPIPVIATKVPTLANGLVRRRGKGMDVTVPINPKAAWNDGHPLTCADVRFTWQTIMDERWVVLSRAGWDVITGVDCPDPHTAVLHFRTVYSDYLNVLVAILVPEHDQRGKDFNSSWVEDVPVSNGPFEFDRWEHGTYIRLRRNEKYWRSDQGLPRLEGVEFRFLQDPNTLNLQLSTGEIDMISRPLNATVDRERATFPRSTYVVTPTMIVQLFTFNHSHAPMNDPRIRQAVAYSIDREQLIDVILGKPFRLLHSTLVPQLGDYFVAPFDRYRPDPDKADGLLREAGYQRAASGYYERRGEPLTLQYKGLADKGTSLQIAQLLQHQMKQAGIRMQITLETPQVFFGQTLRSSAYDIIFWDQGVRNPVQRSFFHCEPSPGRGNAGRYCNKRVSAMIDQAENALDPRVRIRLVREMQQIIADELPVLPLYQRLLTAIYAPGLRNVSPNPNSTVTWDVANWSWVDGTRDAERGAG